MNISHRSIWNSSLGAWVAVSEITRACGKRSGGAVMMVALGASVCSSVGAQVVIDGGASETVPGTQASPWNIGNTLIVGNTGTGTLTVQAGGSVSNITGRLGQNAGSIGNATVTGAGSTWTNTANLVVGSSGTGRLTVRDGGTVSSDFGTIGVLAGGIGHATVSGAGATWTNSGTLTLGFLGTGTLTVQDGGRVSTFRAGLGQVANSTGNATVSGAGATWTNTNTLEVGASGTGTLTIANGGNVSVNNGIGMLNVATNPGSTGRLNIGAAAGSAAQAAGTVAAGELRFGAGTGSLNFNHTDTAYTFGTLITGAGVLNHYAGTTLLTGTNTYSGATTVNGGTLRVNGSNANSAVTVNSGGTLGGNGTVGNTSILSGGVLAPGNSIGTLTINGNATFAAGSIYRVEVDAAGNNDRTNVTGIATLNGGTVDVLVGAGSYAVNTTYTILNATGGRTGVFAGVTSNANLAFLTPTLGYGANNVFLTLLRNGVSFSAIAITPNQFATATALQNATPGATGDMSTVISAVTSMSAAQARAAYDSASGAGIVALRNAGAGFAAGFGSQLQARLGQVQGFGIAQAGVFAGGPIVLAANGHVSDLMTPVSDAAPQKFSLSGGASASTASSQGRGFWLRGSGGYQNTKSDDNAAASELKNSSISAGFDTELREGLVIGAALSSGTARLGFDNNTDAGKSRGGAVALYGSYALGPWAFKASASAAWNANHMDRTVTVGALVRQASADFNSNTLSAYGEALYSIPMTGWTLQPVAALSVSRNNINGFTETGAGALNLQVAGQTITSTKSLIGAKASFEAGSVRLEPRIIWAHELGDLNTPMTAQFQGAATASPFQVSGVALKRDTLILGLGASGSISKGMDLFADVQLEHNQRQRNLSALTGVRLRW